MSGLTESEELFKSLDSVRKNEKANERTSKISGVFFCFPCFLKLISGNLNVIRT